MAMTNLNGDCFALISWKVIQSQSIAIASVIKPLSQSHLNYSVNCPMRSIFFSFETEKTVVDQV